VDRPPYRLWPGHYERGRWRDGHGSLVDAIASQDDGVWPAELQREDYYTRAGDGSLGSGNIDDPHAEFRRTDFVGLRDVSFDGDAGQSALHDLARCLKYWIALTDCDGFRIDTLKHVDQQTGRSFCGTIKEFAAGLGKADFFLLGEVAGGDGDARRYREVLGLNLDATLDIGESRRLLHLVAKGRLPAAAYFSFVLQWEDELGSHREAGRRHVSILDDHDHVSGSKVRFSADADTDHQIVAGVAIQLFSLGIPCIYYGTEQALRGPEESEHRWLPEHNAGEPSTDCYLRETMFGAPHPRQSGRAGLQDGEGARDATLPGFGPFGTVGAHCFNPTSAAYLRIAALTEVRRRYPVLRYGRQYQRPVSNFGGPFVLPPAGELIAWSRILDDEEVLCIVNGNGLEARGGDVLVDASLNNPQAAGSPWGGEPPFFEVVASSAQAGAGAAYTGAHPIGEHLPVRLRDATAYVAVRNLAPSEVLVLSNRP
jgi:glycosidase